MSPSHEHEHSGCGHGHAHGDGHRPCQGNGQCQNSTRRKFCQTSIGASAMLSAATVGYPILAFMSLPERVGGARPVHIPLDSLAIGQAQYAEFQGQQVIIIMSEDGPRVFDAGCTHLGCNVVWETAHSQFRCPCHGALFADDGGVIRGPVSAPLRQVPFEIKDGVLIIA